MENSSADSDTMLVIGQLQLLKLLEWLFIFIFVSSYISTSNKVTSDMVSSNFGH